MRTNTIKNSRGIGLEQFSPMLAELPINQIICGDALLELKKLPKESIDCIITSPPYWGLRDYGIEGQIGLEKTLEEYLKKLLEITAELKRVLKKSGVMFWNHGTNYGGAISAPNAPILLKERIFKRPAIGIDKCLTLQNWRLILKMIDEQDWILRNTIIWNKPNAMPSSVKDRFANKYEPVFMLVKNKKYWFDLNAVRVPPKREYWKENWYPKLMTGQGWYNPKKFNSRKPTSFYAKGSEFVEKYGEPWDRFHKWDKNKFNYRVRDAQKKSEQCPQFKATKEEIERYKKYTSDYVAPIGPNMGKCKERQEWCSRTPNWSNIAGKNPGDVFSIPTQPCPKDFRGVHFAIFPEKLVEPMILAGAPKNGVVFDPFCGLGTTCVVAKKLGRNYIGIDLKEDYCKIAEARIRATPIPLL